MFGRVGHTKAVRRDRNHAASGLYIVSDWWPTYAAKIAGSNPATAICKLEEICDEDFEYVGRDVCDYVYSFLG